MSNSQGQRREIIRLPEVPRSSTPEPALKRQRTSRTTSKNIANIPRAARPRVSRATRTVGNAEPVVEAMDASARSSDPLEHQVDIAEPAVEAMDASARSSYPLEHRPEERVDNAEPSAEAQMPLRGRAIHSDIERLRQVGILRRRLSRRQETSSPAHVHDTSEPEDRPLMATSWILPADSTSTGVDTGAMPMMDLEQAAWDASVMPVSTGTDTDGDSRAVVSATGDNSDGPTSTGGAQMELSARGQ
jgi:hypothetical protein